MTTVSSNSGARRKRLVGHLEAALTEIEHLADAYHAGIETLERHVLPNLSSNAARQWFLLYLRVVDIGVQIRRGEIRHRTTRSITHACMHTTGTKGAMHSGLSIDDANALYLALEHAHLSESRLEVYFMRMDALDNDRVGVLDIRLSKCLDSLLRTRSAHFVALEVNGSDPHVELLIKGAGSVLATRRTCFRPSDCSCVVDTEPWTAFAYAEEATGSVTSQSIATATTASPTGVHNAPMPAAMSGSFLPAASMAMLLEPVGTNANANNDENDNDVGLSELKRQFGFEPSVEAEDDDDAIDTRSRNSVESTKRRRLLQATTEATATVATAAATVRRLTPMQIYARKCRERGDAPKKKLRDLFVVVDGALHLDLSPIGFQSSENLQDVVDVVTAAEVPIKSLDASNNFFNAPAFDVFCQLLRLPMLTQHVERLVLRCIALPQRADFPTLLRILISTTNDPSDAFALLHTLDLSYNTFTEDAVLCFDAVLTGLKRLETLSLESCFTKAPDPEVVEVAVVKDLVRLALATCCNQLHCLNFGSNYMSFPLLNSLFAPESALRTLSLTQMTFFCFATAGFDASMWDLHFQHLESLTLSETKHSRSEYLPIFLEVLSQSFKTGCVQLKHLDLSIGAARSSGAAVATTPAISAIALNLDAVVLELLQQIGGYGLLHSLRIRMETPMCVATVPNYERVLAVLLAGGFPVCETLDLSLGLPLPISALRDLLANAQLPKTQKLQLSIVALEPEPLAVRVLDADAHAPPSFATAFALGLGAVNEFTLEVKVCEAQRAAILSDELIHELGEAWRALDRMEVGTTNNSNSNSNNGSNDVGGAADVQKPLTPRVTRDVAMTKRKIRRSRGSGTSRDQALVTYVFAFTRRVAGE